MISNIRFVLHRYIFLWAIVTVACASTAHEVHIGYQKYGSLILVKARGNLEKRLASLGMIVKWHEFAAGPEMIAAFKTDNLDFGVVGEAPPVVAQAAGVPFVYIAYEPASPEGEAILLPKDSPIQKVTELKGKKIAVHKNTIAHYFLLTALERENMSFADVKLVFMPPVEGRIALQNGSVDAWVIWDPFFADAQYTLGVKVLIYGNGLVNNHQFYIADHSYVDKNPQVVKILIEEVEKVDSGIKQYPRAVAKLLAPQVGIAADILEIAFSRMNLGIQPMNAEIVKSQQQIADAFYRVGLISKPIKVSKIVWDYRGFPLARE